MTHKCLMHMLHKLLESTPLFFWEDQRQMLAWRISFIGGSLCIPLPALKIQLVLDYKARQAWSKSWDMQWSKKGISVVYDKNAASFASKTAWPCVAFYGDSCVVVNKYTLAHAANISWFWFEWFWHLANQCLAQWCKDYVHRKYPWKAGIVATTDGATSHLNRPWL